MKVSRKIIVAPTAVNLIRLVQANILLNFSRRRDANFVRLPLVEMAYQVVNETRPLAAINITDVDAPV